MWVGVGFRVIVAVFILNFWIFFFFFFMWIGLFFKVYGLDLLEVSVEDRDFEWIFACLFAKKMQ